MPHLDNGAYVVTWRVISADSHPVHGAFTFTVGNSSANAERLAAKLEAQSDGNKHRRRVVRNRRGVAFAGIALLLGAPVFAAAIRPHGRRRSRADALVWIGWIMLFVASVAALLLQGPYGAALPLSKVDRLVGRCATVLKTRYGHIAEIRLLFLLALLPLLLRRPQAWRPAPWWWALATPLGSASRRRPDSPAMPSIGNVDRTRGAGRHAPRHRDEHVARRARDARR